MTGFCFTSIGWVELLWLLDPVPMVSSNTSSTTPGWYAILKGMICVKPSSSRNGTITSPFITRLESLNTSLIALQNTMRWRESASTTAGMRAISLVGWKRKACVGCSLEMVAMCWPW
ncbi:hypothetical protein B0O80DRAFT_464910 [Mortierella sp. GBAus27b]|nr:hypothetical protein B0O80DRAFT_464910 [Mortierella sp. GBAus27b]